MVAVVTDAHFRMSLSIIRDLADAGIEVVACDLDNIKSPCGFLSKGVARTAVLPENGYADALFGLLTELEEPVLFPVGAKTLAAVCRQRERFLSVCHCLISDIETLDLLNDKERVNGIARTLSVPVPRLYTSKTVQYPAVVKPACGEKFGLRAHERYAVVKDSAAFEYCYGRFSDITHEQPLVQEYVTGDAEGVSVLCKDGRVLASVCHRRLREYPITGGPSSCCRRVFLPALERYAEKIVSHTRYSGVAMFEFKGKKLLEVNPRVWGSYPLTRVCGSNFTLVWFYASLGKEIPYNGGKTVSMLYFPSDIAASCTYLLNGEFKRALGGIRDALDPRVKNGMLELRDMRPYLSYLKSLIKRKNNKGEKK